LHPGERQELRRISRDGTRPTSRCGARRTSPQEVPRSMSSDAAAPPIAGAPAPAEVAETELKAGAIGFWGNMVQAVTHIAPGLNVLLGLTFIVSFVFVAAPIAYLTGGGIFLGVVHRLHPAAPRF